MLIYWVRTTVHPHERKTSEFSRTPRPFLLKPFKTTKTQYNCICPEKLKKKEAKVNKISYGKKVDKICHDKQETMEDNVNTMKTYREQ